MTSDELRVTSDELRNTKYKLQNPLNIRLAKEHDIESLIVLWTAFVNEESSYENWLTTSDYNISQFKQHIEMLVEHKKVIVAENAYDTEIVGYVSYDTDHSAFIGRYTTGIIINIYVKPDYRRHGIGTELLQTVLQRIKEEHHHCVKLLVFANNHAAVNFYRKNGFYVNMYYLKKEL